VNSQGAVYSNTISPPIAMQVILSYVYRKISYFLSFKEMQVFIAMFKESYIIAPNQFKDDNEGP